MDIKTKLNLDDEVFIVENVGDRLRPVKRRVYGVQVTVTPQGKKEEYFSAEGPITETFPTMEMAEEALKIIEHYKKAFSDAMEALVNKGTLPQLNLVDAKGDKIVK